MEKSKSVLFYTDWARPLQGLPLEDVGRLFFGILNYTETGRPQAFDSPAAAMAWEFIRLRLDNNLEKWADTKEKRREAGRRAPEGSKYKYEGEIVNLSCWHDLADAALCVQKGDMLDVWVHDLDKREGQNGKTYYYATAEAMVLDLRAVLRVVQTYSNAAPMTQTNIPTPFDTAPEADLAAPLGDADDLPF